MKTLLGSAFSLFSFTAVALVGCAGHDGDVGSTSEPVGTKKLARLSGDDVWQLAKNLEAHNDAPGAVHPQVVEVVDARNPSAPTGALYQPPTCEYIPGAKPPRQCTFAYGAVEAVSPQFSLTFRVPTAGAAVSVNGRVYRQTGNTVSVPVTQNGNYDWDILVNGALHVRGTVGVTFDIPASAAIGAFVVPVLPSRIIYAPPQSSGAQVPSSVRYDELTTHVRTIRVSQLERLGADERDDAGAGRRRPLRGRAACGEDPGRRLDDLGRDERAVVGVRANGHEPGRRRDRVLRFGRRDRHDVVDREEHVGAGHRGARRSVRAHRGREVRLGLRRPTAHDDGLVQAALVGSGRLRSADARAGEDERHAGEGEGV